MCDCQGHKPPLIITPAPDEPCCGGKLPLTEGQQRALAAAALVCKRPDLPLAGRPTVDFTPMPGAPGATPVPRRFAFCQPLVPPGRNPVTGERYPGLTACMSIGPTAVPDPFA